MLHNLTLIPPLLFLTPSFLVKCNAGATLSTRTTRTPPLGILCGEERTEEEGGEEEGRDCLGTWSGEEEEERKVGGERRRDKDGADATPWEPEVNNLQEEVLGMSWMIGTRGEGMVDGAEGFPVTEAEAEMEAPEEEEETGRLAAAVAAASKARALPRVPSPACPAYLSVPPRWAQVHTQLTHPAVAVRH
jgi:hypothetical protein